MLYYNRLSPKIKRDLFRIIPFGIIWFIFAVVYLILEKGLMHNLDYYPATGNEYDFGLTSLINLFGATLAGLVIGTFEIKFLDKLFFDKSFGKKIVYKTIVYILIMIVFLIMISIARYTVQLNTHIFDPEVWMNLSKFLSGFIFWSMELYIAAIIGGTLFFSEVSENLGIYVLHNFLAGKYHKPKVEERIFMFLDMKSSTTIAENIGHVKYFEMLREYYSDLTQPIINHSGEIYQYVGDEIVVSWKLKNGLKHNNFLKCFFAMKALLKNQEEKYLLKFGVLPDFKAGIHLGSVTAGEIGVVKKEIIYTGDVLNATARIQGLCNCNNEDLLISAHLRRSINSDKEFHFKTLGQIELRGRNKAMELYAVKPQN